MRLRLVYLLAVCTFALPQTAVGQTTSVRDVLSVLMTSQDVPTADFVKDQQASEATRDTVARALLIDLATLPVTTSSGGFSYRLNPTLGTVERVTQSFGPFFVNRAATAGRNQASLSLTYQYSNFIKLDGRDLQDGSFETTANKFRDEAAPFDVDALTLQLQTSTITGFANYGITDWLDIGAAVPVVRLTLSGQRVNTYRGTSVVQARGKADTTGLADIAVRSKVQLVRAGSGGVSADVEVRLPTGSPENLRGSGKSAVRAGGIVSAGAGPVEADVNGSFTFGGVSKEASVAAAVVGALSSRLTVSGEAIVRRVDQLSSIQEVTQPHPSFRDVDTIRLLPNQVGITLTQIVAGIRWNLASTWLINAHVLVPLNDRGLTARPTPAISLDYTFAP